MKAGLGNHSGGDRLVMASEIAQTAGVTPSAVSNWRKRFPDFPAPAGTATGGGDLFVLAEVEAWLLRHRRMPKARPGAMEQLWSAADRLRGRALGGDVTSVVAAGAVLLELVRDRGHLTSPPLQNADATAKWLREARSRLEADRPELGRLFTPLGMIDPQSLRLLLDSLAELESSEELSAAVDFVLERGTRYGEFRTPEPVLALVAELAEPRGLVFDPAVGSGGFLIHAAKRARRPLILYGQEISESSWRIAFARLLLRHLDAQIQLGDSLADDRYPNLQADVVVCEPPAGHRTADLSSVAGDPRWQLLGTYDAPPPRAGDFTWLAHVIHHLAPDGRGYVLLAAGSLSRKGVEARFRAELVRQGMIEAIVALPGGTLSGTAVPSALWVVRPPTRTPEPVLLIDASTESGVTSRLRSSLTDTVRTWRAQHEDFTPIPGFATSAPVLELLAGDAPLVPSRWLYEPELVDAGVLIARVDEAQRALASARKRVQLQSPQVKLSPSVEPPTRARVRDLVDLGVATLLRPARIKTEDFGEEEGLPVWLPSDIREPWRRDEGPKFVDPALVDVRSITQPGDIVFTTIGGLRTRVDDEGNHVLGTSLHGLRLSQDAYDPHVVAALLTSEPNRRLLTGTTIPRVDVMELEIPGLDVATAARAGELLRSLEHQVEATSAVVTQAEALRSAIVDALATGAATIDDLSEPDTGEHARKVKK
jgi:hypothetical protein